MTVSLAHLQDVEDYKRRRWHAAREEAQRSALRDKEAFQAYLAASETHTEAFRREQEAFDAWYAASKALSAHRRYSPIPEDAKE